MFFCWGVARQRSDDGFVDTDVDMWMVGGAYTRYDTTRGLCCWVVG